MKPAFLKLRENYYSVAAVDQATLFREIGWEDLIGKDNLRQAADFALNLEFLQ